MGRTSTANKPLPLNNFPKELSVSWESNPAQLFQSPRNYAVKWRFLTKSTPSGNLDRSDTQRQSMLFDPTFKESNYRPFRVCDGSTVNNLVKL
jgi:hypothetical protein